MKFNALELILLTTAARRTIYASLEAGLQPNITKKDAQAAIRKLLRAKLIYACDRTKPNYWGNSETGYRAN